MGMRQSMAVSVALVVAVALVSSCSGTDSSAQTIDAARVVGPDGAAETAGPSSSAVGPTVRSETVESPGDDDDADRERLDAAVASGDLCAVHAALSTLAVTASDLRGLSRTLDLVSGALAASAGFVPDGLADAWSVMEHRIDMARSELSKPGVGTADITEIFDTADYAHAQMVIDDWQQASCA